MLTYSNYSTEVKNVDWAKVPANIKEKRADFEDIMEFYNDDADIKDTIDLYVKQLNNYYKSSAANPEKKGTKKKSSSKKPKFKVGDLVHWIKNPEEVRYKKEPIIDYDRVDKITKIEKNNFGDVQYLTEEVGGNKKGKAYESYLVKAKAKSTAKKQATLKPENLTQFKAWLKHNVGYVLYLVGKYGDRIDNVTREVEIPQSNSVGFKTERGTTSWIDFGSAKQWKFTDEYAQWNSTDDYTVLKYYYDEPEGFELNNNREQPKEKKSSSKKAKAKIKLNQLKIIWSEGLYEVADELEGKVFKSWQTANEAVKPVFEKDSYNKVKFEVTFNDGYKYTGKMYVGYTNSNPYESKNVFGEHIHDFLTSEIEVGSKDEKELREFLQTYDLEVDSNYTKLSSSKKANVPINNARKSDLKNGAILRQQTINGTKIELVVKGSKVQFLVDGKSRAIGTPEEMNDKFNDHKELLESKDRLSTRQQIAKLPNVKLFMPQHQQTVLMQQNSEELDGVLQDLEKQLSEIPRKQNDGPIKDAIVKAHYFYGESDWFITEYHKGSNSFFGYVILNGDDQMSEPGYISVDEITQNGKIELDFYWTNKPLQKALEATSDYFKPKEKEKPAPKKTTSKKKIEKKVEAKTVDHYDDEFKLIRRFYNLVSKNQKSTFRKLQLLYMAFQKAIVSRNVRKSSDNADLLIRVNKKVVALFDIAKENGKEAVDNRGIDIEFKDKALLAEMETLVKGNKVNYAITLLRSYIGFQNRKPAKDKVERLLKRFNNAIKSGRVDKDNRLWKEFSDAKAEMESYIKNPKDEIEVVAYGLSMPARKTCKNRIKCTGLKANGQLKKGHFYVKGGGVAKALHGPICNNRRKCKGLNADGTLKPGYIYVPGGAVVKAGYKKKNLKQSTVKSLGTLVIDIEPEPKPAIAEVEGLVVAEPLVDKSIEEPLNNVSKPQRTKSNKNDTLNELKELGFEIASEGPSTTIETFKLPGEIGNFLQEIQPHKALILIKGTKHTSKSQVAMQIANAFGERGDAVAFIDYEQGGLTSKDTQNSVKWNTTPSGQKNIAIIGFLEDPKQQLIKFCKYCKVIIADSVTDLSITADELNELRTNYPNVIWVFISQVKENGEMYGGNKMAHNPTCIIQCHPSSDPKLRYATLEKNRGNDTSLAYSIYEKKLINLDEFKNPLSNLPERTSI